jgi:N-glycosylase/DNA lyase
MGGQSFAWDFIDGAYYGFTKDSVIKIIRDNENIFWQTFPKKDDLAFVEKYLRLNMNYDEILKKISKDRHVKKAASKYPNIRLLEQDFEQALLSFIISSNNTISSIRKSVRLLNQMYGEKLEIEGKDFYLFPKTEILAEAPLEDILKSKVGFRAKYLKDTAQNLLKSGLPRDIKKLDENEARKRLIELKGVGDKIADCVLVFGLAHDNVTPLDVWAKRVFINLYGLDPKMKYDDMIKWIKKHFDGYAAWAGQFLFEYIRNEKIL